jgi:hypothetical protein
LRNLCGAGRVAGLAFQKLRVLGPPRTEEKKGKKKRKKKKEIMFLRILSYN